MKSQTSLRLCACNAPTMTNSPFCGHCWLERAWGAEKGPMLANWEVQPFEDGTEEAREDYAPESAYSVSE